MQDVLEGKPGVKFEIPKEINTAALNAPIDITAGEPAVFNLFTLAMLASLSSKKRLGPTG